jgi:hypothetical protein
MHIKLSESKAMNTQVFHIYFPLEIYYNFSIDSFPHLQTQLILHISILISNYLLNKFVPHLLFYVFLLLGKYRYAFCGI